MLKYNMEDKPLGPEETETESKYNRVLISSLYKRYSRISIKTIDEYTKILNIMNERTHMFNISMFKAQK